MKRGQLSVEFFLMLAVIAAFIIMLFNVAQTQREQTSLLSAAVASKAGVDELANAANYVFLSGEGSVIRKEFFVANGSLCLYYDPNPGELNLYCTVPGAQIEQGGTGSIRVHSVPLYTQPAFRFNTGVGEPCYLDENIPSNQGKLLGVGWYLFNVSVSSGALVIACENKLD